MTLADEYPLEAWITGEAEDPDTKIFIPYSTLAHSNEKEILVFKIYFTSTFKCLINPHN